MNKLKVVKVDSDSVVFDNGVSLYSEHEPDCCEHHWLDFSHLKLEDFDGLEFDMSNDSFFERVEDYGIRLIPINGHPISIPGYGSNNGYYSSNLDLVVEGNNYRKVYNISDCQSWEAY